MIARAIRIAYASGDLSAPLKVDSSEALIWQKGGVNQQQHNDFGYQQVKLSDGDFCLNLGRLHERESWKDARAKGQEEGTEEVTDADLPTEG